MKILIAPAAFKHSMSAAVSARAIERGLRRSGLPAELYLLPIADGGNGTLDAFLLNGGERVNVPVHDPLGREIIGAYGWLDDKTAVIEMALVSGLELVRELRPLQATTYGTGELMRAALERGVRRVIVGMGGSATVDGGAGCLQALGVHLLDEGGQPLPPGGGELHRLRTIDTSELDPRWRDVEVIIASDVDNPALGEHGAAAVFGPQKGADADAVALLESGLSHFFDQVYKQIGVDVRAAPGGGAAGAFSAGLMAFLGGRIQSGIDLILDVMQFEDQLVGAHLVVTGEGRMDEQTVHGKGPIGVARRAQPVPTVALVGGLDVDDETLYRAGLRAVLPIIPKPMPLDEAIRRGEELLERAALRLGYLLGMRGHDA